MSEITGNVPDSTCVRCKKIEKAVAQNLRLVGDGSYQPINVIRPIGWIAGPSDPSDIKHGLCGACAKSWSELTALFLETRDDHGPALIEPPPIPQPNFIRHSNTQNMQTYQTGTGQTVQANQRTIMAEKNNAQPVPQHLEHAGERVTHAQAPQFVGAQIARPVPSPSPRSSNVSTQPNGPSTVKTTVMPNIEPVRPDTKHMPDPFDGLE